MPTVDRMFRVIVAGGLALAATAPGVVVGCGGSVSSLPSDGGHGGDAFPTEGPPPQGDSSFPQETAQFVDAFPQEGIDASVRDTGAKDTGGDEDVFPQEGPNLEAGFFDTGVPSTDAGDQPDGFPFETAAP